MEVGIEDCLHIEFEYNKGRYHLRDTVVGKIYFLLVRIKLKHMEIEIRKRETTGAGSSARNDSETLAKYEIMDGAPVRGEAIPIRCAALARLLLESAVWWHFLECALCMFPKGWLFALHVDRCGHSSLWRWCRVHAAAE